MHEFQYDNRNFETFWSSKQTRDDPLTASCQLGVHEEREGCVHFPDLPRSFTGVEIACPGATLHGDRFLILFDDRIIRDVHELDHYKRTAVLRVGVGARPTVRKAAVGESLPREVLDRTEAVRLRAVVLLVVRLLIVSRESCSLRETRTL